MPAAPRRVTRPDLSAGSPHRDPADAGTASPAGADSAPAQHAAAPTDLAPEGLAR
ncbi:hypothetical protein [Actinomyces ruminis]|uniref:hypothetical protein n=1 Tax=Actinomyces ruminis TaxID=1937003 RepID=UPI0015D5115E|nr:hypothetical protein [Actinomyces ruminis]